MSDGGLFERRSLPSRSSNPVTVTSDPARVGREPPATFKRNPPSGESGFARVSRLQRETPPCTVCGKPSVLYRRTLRGKDVYRCVDHISGTVSSIDPEEREYLNELAAIMASVDGPQVSEASTETDLQSDGVSDTLGVSVESDERTSCWVVCPRCLDSWEGDPDAPCRVCGGPTRVAPYNTLGGDDG